MTTNEERDDIERRALAVEAKSDGGPAFPRSGILPTSEAPYGIEAQVGMTKREVMASEQMAGLLANSTFTLATAQTYGTVTEGAAAVAEVATIYTDALLAELDK